MAKIAQNAKAAEEVEHLRAKVAELEQRLETARLTFVEQEEKIAELEAGKPQHGKSRNR